MKLVKQKIHLRSLREDRKPYPNFFKENVSYLENNNFVLFTKNNFKNIGISAIQNIDAFQLKEKQQAVGLWTYGYKKPNNALVKMAEDVSEVFKSNLPKLFKKHSDIVKGKKTIGKSIFTSVVINEDYDVGYHYDANTLKNTLEAMVTIKEGPEGSYLNFDEFKYTLKNDNNNIVIFDGVKYGHSVTKMPEGQKRYTLLFLIHENIG